VKLMRIIWTCNFCQYKFSLQNSLLTSNPGRSCSLVIKISVQFIHISHGSLQNFIADSPSINKNCSRNSFVGLLLISRMMRYSVANTITSCQGYFKFTGVVIFELLRIGLNHETPGIPGPPSDRSPEIRGRHAWQI
jgi:hypothetical protein